jgi:formylglycine-generating enzyme required for sulfatase activity
MASIPGGAYTLGERKDAVNVAPFCLDKTEVTVSAFGTCIGAGACREEPTLDSPGARCNARIPERAQHPMNCVSADQGAAYCLSVGKRLPSEEEWEWAARNGPLGTTYPWGNEPPDARRLNASGAEGVPNLAERTRVYGRDFWPTMYPGDDGFLETAPVGSFPAGDNRWGVHDLAGNVLEWTSSDAHDGQGVRSGQSGPDLMNRGGSWKDSQESAVRAAARKLTWNPPGARHPELGFRCAR